MHQFVPFLHQCMADMSLYIQIKVLCYVYILNEGHNTHVLKTEGTCPLLPSQIYVNAPTGAVSSANASTLEQFLGFKCKSALWLCLVCCDIHVLCAILGMRSFYILSDTCCVNPVLCNCIVLFTPMRPAPANCSPHWVKITQLGKKTGLKLISLMMCLMVLKVCRI